MAGLPPVPKAVVIVSAHWEDAAFSGTAAPHPYERLNEHWFVSLAHAKAMLAVRIQRGAAEEIAGRFDALSLRRATGPKIGYSNSGL